MRGYIARALRSLAQRIDGPQTIHITLPTIGTKQLLEQIESAATAGLDIKKSGGSL